MEQRYCQIW